MGAKRRLLALVLFLSMGVSGCCAPKDTFNCLDQCCYFPDWTNCNSCNSECWRKDGYNHHWVCPCSQP